jgi:hypothetical protein
MYYRTSLAAVQDDSATDKNVSLSSKSAAYTPTERTIWAKVPLKTKHGRCVAVKLRGNVVLIGISCAPAVQWVPVQKVLTEAEVEAWAKVGF